MADAIRSIDMTEVTDDRRRKEFAGPKVDQVKRLKKLETGNQRRRKAIADPMLDKRILSEAALADCRALCAFSSTVPGASLSS